MRWVSIDPGQVHVGYAMWENHCLMDAMELKPTELLPTLQDERPNEVVIEGFSLLSPKYNKHAAAQAVDTIELIGKVKGLCWYMNVPVITQAPALRHIAFKNPAWVRVFHECDAGFSKSNDHIRSAVGHGLYYLLFNQKVAL